MKLYVLINGHPNSRIRHGGVPGVTLALWSGGKLTHVQVQRFYIEHSFHEAKSECGMADYQVRRWDAWHHHIALVILATQFLVHMDSYLTTHLICRPEVSE